MTDIIKTDVKTQFIRGIEWGIIKAVDLDSLDDSVLKNILNKATERSNQEYAKDVLRKNNK